jgi:hypothetical protein
MVRALERWSRICSQPSSGRPAPSLQLRAQGGLRPACSCELRAACAQPAAAWANCRGWREGPRCRLACRDGDRMRREARQGKQQALDVGPGVHPRADGPRLRRHDARSNTGPSFGSCGLLWASGRNIGAASVQRCAESWARTRLLDRASVESLRPAGRVYAVNGTPVSQSSVGEGAL